MAEKDASPQIAKASRPKPSHPPFFEMAKVAIGALADKKGSSVQSIQTYIAGNYNLDIDFVKIRLKPALAKGIESETFVRPKGSESKGYTGRFKLNKIKQAEEAKAKAKKEKAAAKADKKPASKTDKKKPASKTDKKTTASKTKVKVKSAAQSKASKSPGKSPKKAVKKKPVAKAAKSPAKAKAKPATPKKAVKKPKVSILSI